MRGHDLVHRMQALFEGVTVWTIGWAYTVFHLSGHPLFPDPIGSGRGVDVTSQAIGEMTFSAGQADLIATWHAVKMIDGNSPIRDSYRGWFDAEHTGSEWLQWQYDAILQTGYGVEYGREFRESLYAGQDVPTPPRAVCPQTEPMVLPGVPQVDPAVMCVNLAVACLQGARSMLEALTATPGHPRVAVAALVQVNTVISDLQIHGDAYPGPAPY